MKIDAKALVAKHSKQRELGKEGQQTINEVADRGEHISHMMSLIEAVHKKDPQAAHEHMINYAKSQSAKDSAKPSEPQNHE